MVTTKLQLDMKRPTVRLVSVAAALLSPIGAALQPKSIGRVPLTRLRAGSTLSQGFHDGSVGGRGNGVDPQELADFIAVHSYSTEEALADKTANQCYDPEDLHQAGFLRLRAGTLFQNSFIWKQGLFLALVALLSGIIGWNFSDAHDMDYFEHLEDALHSIIIFFMVGSTKLNSHHIGHFGSNCAAFWTVLCALIVQRRVYS